MAEKICNKCKELKNIDMFHNRKDGLYGKWAVCKQCRAISSKENKEKIDEYNRDYYKKNKDSKNKVSREWHQKNKNNPDYIQHRKKYSDQYYKDNKEMFYEKMVRRRVQVKNQPITIKSTKQLNYLMKIQKGECYLTGETKDLQLEHFIPVSIGHAGHTFRNCYYLEKKLNSSKRNKNPLVWIKGQKKEIQDNFYNVLLPTLAKRNKMSVEQYIDYINWCFDNPQEFYEQTKLVL